MDGGDLYTHWPSGFITTLLAIFFCVNKQKSVFGGSADIRTGRTRLPLCDCVCSVAQRKQLSGVPGTGRTAPGATPARSQCDESAADPVHPDGAPLRATAILRGGGGCVVGLCAFGKRLHQSTGPQHAQRCWILGILLVLRYRNRLD
jgi:hypothetical protein